MKTADLVLLSLFMRVNQIMADATSLKLYILTNYDIFCLSICP